MTNRLLLLAIAAIATSAPAHAQTDTVKVVRDISEVVVTKSANGLINVQLKGKPKNTDYAYSYRADVLGLADDSASTEPLLPVIPEKKKLQTWRELWFPGCYVGMMAATNGNTLGMKVARSWEIGISMLGVRYRPWQSMSHFTATIDLTVRTFNTGKSDIRLTGNSPLTAVLASTGISVKNNNITIGQLSVPVAYHQTLTKSLEMAVGAQLNWNFYSRAMAKFTYSDEPTTYKRTMHGLNQRAFTVDYTVSVGWRGNIHLYAKYSPFSAYAAEFGPKLKSVSFGVKFGY